MILEAFSTVLKDEWQESGWPAKRILHQWLTQELSAPKPKQPQTEAEHVRRVLQTELRLAKGAGHTALLPQSTSGERLLKSLYLYCDSFEQWQFSRWLHAVKAHQFSLPY